MFTHWFVPSTQIYTKENASYRLDTFGYHEMNSSLKTLELSPPSVCSLLLCRLPITLRLPASQSRLSAGLLHRSPLHLLGGVHSPLDVSTTLFTSMPGLKLTGTWFAANGGASPMATSPSGWVA